MSAGDVFLLAVRWLHLISAASWVGGSVFYLLVLRPASRSSTELRQVVPSIVAAHFRVLVDVSIVVLVATGVILAFNRLTGGVVAAPYVVTLGIKAALSVWMFQSVLWERRRTAVMAAYRQQPPVPSTRRRRLLELVSGYNVVVTIGIVVFLLSDLLQALFIQDLGRD